MVFFPEAHGAIVFTLDAGEVDLDFLEPLVGFSIWEKAVLAKVRLPASWV